MEVYISLLNEGPCVGSKINMFSWAEKQKIIYTQQCFMKFPCRDEESIIACRSIKNKFPKYYLRENSLSGEKRDDCRNEKKVDNCREIDFLATDEEKNVFTAFCNAPYGCEPETGGYKIPASIAVSFTTC